MIPRVFDNQHVTLSEDPWLKRLFHSDAYQQGLNHAQRCVDLDPASPGCHRALGIIYARLGRKDEAIREYRAADKLMPQGVSTDVSRLLAAHDWYFMK